jgi:hypothetical protein
MICEGITMCLIRSRRWTTVLHERSDQQPLAADETIVHCLLKRDLREPGEGSQPNQREQIRDSADCGSDEDHNWEAHQQDVNRNNYRGLFGPRAMNCFVEFLAQSKRPPCSLQ